MVVLVLLIVSLTGCNATDKATFEGYLQQTKEAKARYVDTTVDAVFASAEQAQATLEQAKELDDDELIEKASKAVATFEGQKELVLSQLDKFDTVIEGLEKRLAGIDASEDRQVATALEMIGAGAQSSAPAIPGVAGVLVGGLGIIASMVAKKLQGDSDNALAELQDGIDFAKKSGSSGGDEFDRAVDTKLSAKSKKKISKVVQKAS